ncbi:MerR family transcriptional regulator [Aneurinibacillus sp. REN35]|uniref:MerR family transcriptional regulator n=1 Tax=Aneurinibacillus sp. REN35 TaxID=3237286 RepID=UPI00352714D1
MNTYTAKQVTDILQKEGQNINLRTIRYYTQIGMIPPLTLVGNKRVYTEEHLHYFRAVLTLAKAGDTLADIQDKLKSLTIEEIEKIGNHMPFYQPDRIMENETHQVSGDVFLTVSPNISAETRQKIIASISQILKGETK